jgi:hypothetical protein
VESISLLFTTFKRVTNGKTVQIPNIVLNGLWVENITRSTAMREQISMYVNFDTSFEDIRALKDEMHTFVMHKDNNRDFQPEVEIEVAGIAEMNKLELRIEIRHKSNWANETIRAARRSKFMCALVLAIRKVPIYGPGGGDAALGDIGKPSFSVAVSAEQAQLQKDEFAAAKEAKRLFPSKKPDDNTGKSSGVDTGNTSSLANRATEALNTRNPAHDPSRDEALGLRSPGGTNEASFPGQKQRSSEDRQVLDQVTELMRGESSHGKRKTPGPPPARSPPPPGQGATYVPTTQGYDFANPQANSAYQSPSYSATPAVNPNEQQRRPGGQVPNNSTNPWGPPQQWRQ